MGRVIGIDYGMKRTGLAVTDPLRIIASALETVDSAKAIVFLGAYVTQEDVDGFVVGLPMNLDGRPTDATAGVQAFITALKKAFPDRWVETVDERFTSRMAHDALIMSGKGRMARREKGQLDRISATIILQGWLSTQS